MNTMNKKTNLFFSLPDMLISEIYEYDNIQKRIGTLV